MLRPQLHGMTRRVVLNYLAVDLLFEGEIGLGFSYVLGLQTTAERLRFFVELAIVAASLLTPFLVSLALLLRPVERWIADDAAGRATPAQLEHVGRLLRRIPMQFTILQMVKWPTVYAIVGLVHGNVPSQAALWLFVVTFFFGPPPIDRPLDGHPADDARDEPLLGGRPRCGDPSERTGENAAHQARALQLCLCMAPAFYMSSVVVVVQMSVVSGTGLAMLVGCFLVAVVVFAAVCAALLADTITSRSARSPM